ncbi:UDP-N-acetylmuramoyl-tripeptide--D-alanyl-D-alanine ligase [Marinoscillum furvescens]|uniref:UDP-N-acetylmuramoyl-tripeptide--D-alanyl-D-alanine ligase n=1 Tax=Marinoscillum furvescens DSM 4134 TaxID=1122208 RepID=A0A3D9L386_MARFU|nr:UDP-N-acetylmuramoyl-tripeptide--D-alanyl-D-alanine ligase [Marinoscillum furvescens]RED99566.1 UDP-N-acetylmuramoyl-tripeptide--D-alanyl-D-alanine ligase [Marinoscillum furvescens DSM 4134]
MENFIEYLYSKFLQSDGVSIDTRTIEQDNLFFALKGPNFDANKYASQALEKGAAFAVVDDEQYATDPRIILAEDCEKALQDLAIFHRSRYKRKLLAITGSNGKTTTKELVNRVLSKKYITHATKGNLNNHLGVPLTLLHIHPQVEVAIIEMGANHVGEIAELCRMANPNYGLITNIGEAHTEYFGGIEGVLRGKSELFDHLRKTDGKPFINQQDHRLSNMAKRFDQPTLFPSADLQLISADPYIRIELAGEDIQTQLIGAYNFGNIAAAVAVGREFGVSDEQIAEAIAGYVPANQRSQVVEKNGLQLIVDCYNANPTSMQAAIENLAGMTGKKSVILGDMKEVENSATKHQELGQLVDSKGFDRVVFVGAEMEAAHQEVPHSVWYPDVVALERVWGTLAFEGTVLLKASRSVGLDRLVERF